MVKKEEKKENQDFSVVAYIFGIASIVFAVFNSPAGIVLGIIGLVQSGKQKTELSRRAKKLSKIGLVLSIILLVASIAITAYLESKGIGGGFPVA